MDDLRHLFEKSFHDDSSVSTDQAVVSGNPEPGSSLIFNQKRLLESDKLPKPKSHVQLKLSDDTTMFVKVLSFQPKRQGKDGDWLNVHIQGNAVPSGVHWKDVVSWNEIPDQEEIFVFLH